MKFHESLFRPRGAAMVAAVLAALVTGTIAHGELAEFDGMQGREYHARFYEKGRCQACHDSADPAGYPQDGACLKCHEADDLAEATAPESDDEQGQNPHDSLHYGKDVPCVECHGEHSNKKPLCADCHNFDYPAHQE